MKAYKMMVTVTKWSYAINESGVYAEIRLDGIINFIDTQRVTFFGKQGEFLLKHVGEHSCIVTIKDDILAGTSVNRRVTIVTQTFSVYLLVHQYADGGTSLPIRRGIITKDGEILQ